MKIILLASMQFQSRKLPAGTRLNVTNELGQQMITDKRAIEIHGPMAFRAKLKFDLKYLSKENGNHSRNNKRQRRTSLR